MNVPLRRRRLSCLLPLCALAAAAAGTAHAQQNTDATPGRRLDAIVVQGEIAYRNRTEDTAPVLSYDLEFFQRFEPLTVGDMLKRVPSVGFVSDILEFDGARLRGLDPSYTQILINGEKVPGAGDDRSFFVDRIPAELVERIEIVRSSSANRSGDAVAGAINIVLRDAYQFDGAYLRAGALSFDDGEVKGTGGGVLGTEFAGGRVLAGFNVQGRRNPKTKRSDRFEEPGGDIEDREDQRDVRNGTDYSANLSYRRPAGAGELELSGFWILTDRTETEQSQEFNDPVSDSRDNLLSVADQRENIDQTNYALKGAYEIPMLGGSTALKVGFSQFDDELDELEVETGFDDDDLPPSFDGSEGTLTLSDTEDSEFSTSLGHVRSLAPGVEIAVGLDFQLKDREAERRVSEVEGDEEGAPLPPFEEFDEFLSDIEETRIDPYLMLSGDAQPIQWEMGLRYETTDTDITFVGQPTSNNDYSFWLPSAHLRWDFTELDRLRLSVARTVRRPDFNLLLPFTIEEEFGDNDFRGNPQLDPETAWGIDVGYERRLGRKGVIGVNFFYRDVSDLIEIVGTGEPSATAIDDFDDEVGEFLEDNPGATPEAPGFPQFEPDSFVFSAANVGDGHVLGVEFDLSMPLDFVGLPDTGLFGNYAWLDSEVDDFLGERRFNNQSRYIYNVGFIHDLPDFGASFGLTFRKQGRARARILGEEVQTTYDGDLEVFIEKRFGARLAVRLTGANLLDARKDEVFNKFDTLAGQIDRDFAEFELESERSGPVYQLIARYAF